MMTDNELIDLAARAQGWIDYPNDSVEHGSHWHLDAARAPFGPRMSKCSWNPLTDDGDRYRLAMALGISIDFQDCSAWKRTACGEMIQEFWGGECGDEAHAVLRVAAELGRRA